MKKLLFPLFMLAMIVTSCEKDPDMNKLDQSDGCLQILVGEETGTRS